MKHFKSVNTKISRIGRQKRKNEFFLIWPKEPICLPVSGNGIKRWHIVKHGVEWSGFVKHGFVKHGFVKAGFVKAGFVKAGFVKGGFVKHGFVKGGFVKHGFVKGGFVKGGFVKHDNLKLKRATRKVRIFFSRRSNRKPCRGQ